MSAKFNQAARAATIFLNEDLTQLEQRNHSKLLPLYRALRAKQVPCRLDRVSLVMNSKVFFDLETARKTLLLEDCPNSDFRSMLEVFRHLGNPSGMHMSSPQSFPRNNQK